MVDGVNKNDSGSLDIVSRVSRLYYVGNRTGKVYLGKGGREKIRVLLGW